MVKIPQISGAEREVMKVLWEEAPLTGAEVAARMAAHPKTVKTLLGRLVKKGAVRFKEEGNRYLYRPALARAAYVAAETRSFLQRVFGGEATPALVHFVESVPLSEEEIRELEELLDKKRKET
jgi:BlaI family penicillinase repressor